MDERLNRADGLGGGQAGEEEEGREGRGAHLLYFSAAVGRVGNFPSFRL